MTDQMHSVVHQYNGGFSEDGESDGGTCTFTPLQNDPSIEFANCSWPVFDVFPTEAT